MLAVKDLQVHINTGAHDAFILKNLDLDVLEGNVTALTGQSGSGKTTAAFAITGLLNFHIPGAVVNGQILFDGRDILGMRNEERRDILGRHIAFIPQSAYAGLNPFLSIQRQTIEVAARIGTPKKQALLRFKTLLDLLDLENSEAVIRSYPHQLSGGMRQRVLIAMAILNRPRLLIADEPTTAVDRTNQVKALDLIRNICDDEGLGALIVTHDMGVAARVADTVTVLLSGLAMESGDAARVLKQPAHPYTASLLRSLYHVGDYSPENPELKKKSVSGCPFAHRCAFAEDKCRRKLPGVIRLPSGVHIRCHLTERMAVDAHLAHEKQPLVFHKQGNPVIEVRGLSVSYKSGLLLKNVFRKKHKKSALRHLSFDLLPGRCLGIVGESGAGKTTAMKGAARLISLENGKIIYKGTDITRLGYRALMPLRAGMQVVFQNPDASLNPKMKIRDILFEPSRLHRTYSDKRQEEGAAVDMFTVLELDQELFNRYPEQLSHGQKQRVAIARALITNPDLLFADEPVSALDPFIRSKILGLFRQKMEQGMAIVLISHDLEIVKLMSDTTIVMYKGRVVESGPSDDVYERPYHPYTKELMSAVLTTDPETERNRRINLSPPTGMWQEKLSGCLYYSKCSIKKDECKVNVPPLIEISHRRWVACKAHKEKNHLRRKR